MTNNVIISHLQLDCLDRIEKNGSNGVEKKNLVDYFMHSSASYSPKEVVESINHLLSLKWIGMGEDLKTLYITESCPNKKERLKQIETKDMVMNIFSSLPSNQVWKNEQVYFSGFQFFAFSLFRYMSFLFRFTIESRPLVTWEYPLYI